MIRFGSVCSGIEAASIAFAPLGWQAAWLAEIEPFPCAVLAHHYPDVPNLGDMTKIAAMVRTGAIDAPDIFCGGTPCQAFSVAGLRKSLDDARGNLSLTFCEIANEIDSARHVRGEQPAIVFWENVPGVLNTKDNAFGCFLAGLAGEDDPLIPPGGKWTNAGAVLGPKRAVAWRVTDAQYFGVAQRRRRVFVVASAREGFDPTAVLFEFDGMRRDTAPSREARQVSPTIPARSTAGGGLGTDFDLDGGVIQAFGGNNQSGPIDVATTRNACASASGRMDFESETFLVQHTHTLRGEGFDASEDGTGRGTPLVPVAFHPTQDPISSTDGTTHALGCGSSGGQASVAVAIQDVRGTDKAQNGRGWSDDGTAYTLDTHATQGVAICGAFFAGQGAKAGSIAYSTDIAPTLKASDSGTNRTPSVHINTHPVAFQPRHYSDRERMGGEPSDVCHTLSAQAGQGDSSPHIASNMQVRRLTPVECEALQGFPTVSEKITIQACLDHQNQSVRVALKCLRWQNSALSAEESALTQPAKTAAVPSITSPAHLAPLAALHVRMHSVDELLEIRSAGRLIWSASGAGQSKRSLPPTLTENSVQELARLLREVARTITAGKAASPPSISLSFPASFGATSAEKFGRETEVSASGAMNDQSRGMFTTSALGLITMYSGSTVETLCCSALRAIAGCIPNKTLPETFSIELTVETPYTAIPWRKKPASECPDGPRYKALGNSWAVPNVRWIGKRIDAAIKSLNHNHHQP